MFALCIKSPYEMVEKETQTRLYNQLFQSVLCGIVQYRFLDTDNIIFENANQEAIRIFGYNNESFWAKKVWPLKELISGEDWERVIYDFPLMTQQGQKRDYEYRILRKDGAYCWIIGNAEAVRIDEKGPLIQSVFLDINTSKRGEIRNQMLSEQVEAGNLLLRMALEHTSTCEFYYYPRERTGVFPPQTRRQYHCKERYTEMPESLAEDMVDEAWRGPYLQMFAHIHKGRDTGCAEFKAQDGRSWCRITMSVVSRADNGVPSLVVGIIEDITMAKEMELSLEEAHSKDELTGLYNRESGIRLIKEFMNTKPREQSSSLMLLDMDDFGRLNREEGHAFANAILQDVANIIRTQTAPEDILVRLGGDEFLLFLKQCDKSYGIQVGTNIVGTIKDLFRDHQDIPISASMGMCVSTYVNEYNGLYRCAESTLYYVKENQKGSACCYLDASNALGTMLTQLYTVSYDFNEIEEPFGYQEDDLISFALDLLGKAKKLDDAVFLLLTRIGKCHGLDRVMVVEYNQEYLSMRCSYQWVRIPSDSCLGQTIYVNREDLDTMIHFYDEDGVNTSAELEFCSMPSCLHVPIWNQGTFAGFLSLESKKQNYPWTAEQKKNTKELAKIIASYVMKAKADLVSQAKTEFLSRMSHEIRTPMNAISGMTAIAKAVIDDKEKALECLNKIEYANQYLLSLVNDVLDMSRIESGKLETKPENCDLGDLLEKLYSLMLSQAQAKKLVFTFLNDYQTNRPVKVDALRLNQVLVNIIGNAIKFTNIGGSVTLQMFPEIVSENSIHICFSVKDSGIGIASEEVGRIFNPFEQATQDTVRKYGGTGLGLSISSRLVQMMGGLLQVESVLGKGSKFFFTLPLTYGTLSVQTRIPVETSNTPPISFTGMRLLLAEDNELNREIAETLLQMHGFRIDATKDGQEALQKFIENPPGYYDAILMDIRMPVMNGLEATRYIRACEKRDAHSIPIIAMTANAFDEDFQKSMDNGMDGHLTKPLVLDQLLSLLQKCFLQRKSFIT